jgi:hypothetical protein
MLSGYFTNLRVPPFLHEGHFEKPPSFDWHETYPQFEHLKKFPACFLPQVMHCMIAISYPPVLYVKAFTEEQVNTLMSQVSKSLKRLSTGAFPQDSSTVILKSQKRIQKIDTENHAVKRQAGITGKHNASIEACYRIDDEESDPTALIT